MSHFGETFTAAQWFKSKRSSSSQGCVEVALTSSAAGVRDSKDRNGGTLVFDAQQWKSFLTTLRS